MYVKRESLRPYYFERIRCIFAPLEGKIWGGKVNEWTCVHDCTYISRIRRDITPPTPRHVAQASSHNWNVYRTVKDYIVMWDMMKTLLCDELNFHNVSPLMIHLRTRPRYTNPSLYTRWKKKLKTMGALTHSSRDPFWHLWRSTAVPLFHPSVSLVFAVPPLYHHHLLSPL